MNTQAEYKVLIIENDRDIRELMEEFLQLSGILSRVEFACDCIDAVGKSQDNLFDMVILDGSLSKIAIDSTVKILRRSKSTLTKTPIYFIAPMDESIEVNWPDSFKIIAYDLKSFFYKDFYADTKYLAQ